MSARGVQLQRVSKVAAADGLPDVVQLEQLRATALRARLKKVEDMAVHPLLKQLHTKVVCKWQEQLQGTEVHEPALSLNFGRHSASDVVLDSHERPSLTSRDHACVTYDLYGGFLLLDKFALNGTYVNGKRILPGKERQVFVGDVLSFGGPAKVMHDGREKTNPFCYLITDGPLVADGSDHSAPVAGKRKRSGDTTQARALKKLTWAANQNEGLVTSKRKRTQSAEAAAALINGTA